MDALLERLGLVYVVLAVLVALQSASRNRALAATGLALLALAAAADRMVEPPASGSFPSLNDGLALAGIALVLGALLYGLLQPPHLASPQFLAAGTPRPPSGLILNLLLLGGLALAAGSPHLVPLGIGAGLALASGVGVTLRSRRVGWLIPLLLGAVGLLAALGLMLTILGPLGGRVATLREGPFSGAAERLLVLLLGAVSLLLAGLPPFRHAPWGRRLAPLAAILLIRLIVRPFAFGLLVWQAPFMLFLLGGLVWLLFARGWASAAVAAGMMALWSGAPEGLWAGSVLVVWGWLVETGAACATRRGMRLTPRWRGILALPAALAGLPALAAGLGAQVLLSVLAAAGCAAGFLLFWRRTQPAPAAPLY